MQNKNYLSLLGLARRAGKLSMGHDTVLESIRKRKAKLLLFSSDIAERLVDEMTKATERFCPALPCCRLTETMEELHLALGYRAGVLAVNDSHFADRLIELINQEENVYGD